MIILGELSHKLFHPNNSLKSNDQLANNLPQQSQQPQICTTIRLPHQDNVRIIQN